MDNLDDQQWQGIPYRFDLPTPAQIGAFMTAVMLASPAMLGGMPVLPVTIDEQRRRQQEVIAQESSSTVGVYQSSSEAEAGLALSQRRLAAATREVEHTTVRAISEQDVVRAARKVLAGEAPTGQSRRFRSALGRVANDSVDYFILWDDEPRDYGRDVAPDYESDPEAWLASFEGVQDNQ